MKHQKIQALIFWCDRKMSGMILNFDGNEINQKEFETYKKQIGIPSANINKMVISDRFKNSNKSVNISLAVWTMILLHINVLCCLK